MFELQQVDEVVITTSKPRLQKSDKKIVLITGASSGIGRATADYLSSNGFKVYGTTRKELSFKPAFHPLKMDVTDTESIKEGIKSIVDIEKKIDVLINNAGNGIAGSIEDTSLEEARYQFETNFFGVSEMCRAVIPYMRNEGGGMILNISSMGGIIGLPFQGYYSASKFAVEGFSEALRIELKKYNIHVVLVEPGDIKTSFTENRKITSKSLESGLYFEQFQKSLKTIEQDENKGADPEFVARKIQKIINKQNPKARYLVGVPLQRLTAKLKTFLPSGVFESIIASHYNCAEK